MHDTSEPRERLSTHGSSRHYERPLVGRGNKQFNQGSVPDDDRRDAARPGCPSCRSHRGLATRCDGYPIRFPR